MPADEPTPSAGDAASSEATFRGAERVDEHVGETPAVGPEEHERREREARERGERERQEREARERAERERQEREARERAEREREDRQRQEHQRRLERERQERLERERLELERRESPPPAAAAPSTGTAPRIPGIPSSQIVPPVTPPTPTAAPSSGPAPTPSSEPDRRESAVTGAHTRAEPATQTIVGSSRAPGEPTTPSPTPKGRVRARKVRRIVRHVEPWSVLKISVLFYAALFLIVCVASALLWGAARASGTVDNMESFITSVGGFGNCEPIDGAAPVTTTVPPSADPTGPVDQIDPTGPEDTEPAPGETGIVSPSDDEDCREGEQLVGEFQFEDARIFQAFALGGIVLVLAGSAANVVMVLLFNLMSDLTGGVRVTVLEEDPPARARVPSGSPPPRARD